MGEEIPELTNGEFDLFVREGLVFLDFFADWCMPCTMMSPIIDELAEKFRDKIKFGKVNVDDGQKIASKFEVSSVPTFVLLEEGKIVERFSGARSGEDIEEILKKHLE